jgi:hypothetical protein
MCERALHGRLAVNRDPNREFHDPRNGVFKNFAAFLLFWLPIVI